MLRQSLIRISRRGYAEPAVQASQKLKLTLVSPHKTLVEEKEVERVDIPSTAGDMGILSNHVPTIQQLRPGVMEVLSEGGQVEKFFVSSGFAVVNPDNSINVNVLECVVQDQVDKNAVRLAVTDANSRLDKAADEQEKALISAELEVYQALEKF